MKKKKKPKDDPPTLGRPTKYKADFARQAELFCKAGATDAELADLFLVDTTTIWRWKLEHPNFCNALKVGKGLPDDRVVRSLFHNAVGYDYYEEQIVKFKTSIGTEQFEIVKVLRHRPSDTTAQIYWTKNRIPDQFRDRGTNEIPDLTPEQLASLAPPPPLSADEPGPQNPRP
jgi:hypothetical protein